LRERDATDRKNGFALENEAHMKTRYPGGMSYTEWKRTPFRVRHRLVGFAINNMLRYWRSCGNANCRRARACQNFACYWRRLQELSFEDAAQHKGRGRPSALLSENYAAVCASAVRSIACAR
jgi:hypothetical protein